MILSRRTRIVTGSTLLGLAAWSSTGCGDESATADGPVILATTTIWADVASHVACGEPVPAIMPSGADPHSFEPSLRDRALIEDADVVIANGNDLEHSLVDLLHTVTDDGVDVIEITPHVELLSSEHDHDEPAQDEHDHGTDDPHVWQDPLRGAGALDVIADALIAAGRDAAEIETCRDAYADELTDLDAEIAAMLAPIPEEHRVLVTSHDSLAYFADRYDFRVVGTVIPASNTLAETSSAQLADLADVIDELRVPAIFTEQLESTTDADALAERLDVGIVPLVTDALVDDASGDTYVEMLRGNATKIAEALAT